MRRFAFAVLSVVLASAQGQIVLKPSGEDAIKLSPKSVDVHAEIRGGVADTVWTYTFANADRYRGQADFLIAIPKGGVVHGFAYWYQGEKVVARITEKERAKRIYQAIVTRQRDPALIEMVGKNTFRVRVFPIDGDADLKVELKMAQPMSARSGGATYSIPLKSLGKLESAAVEVTGERKLQGSWGPVGSSLKYSIANSNATDLKVTEAWAPQALHASLRAARSGGPGGFFALTLTPSQTLRHRRWRVDGDVADVVEVSGAGGSTMLVGRYRKPGPVRAWLMGDGYKAAKDLTMSDTVEANGPAAKLWAWSRIGRSKDRKEIVALSMRHAVPSKYTSWIAIPTEERKRMAREIAQAELTHEVAKVIPTLRRVGVTSPKGRAIVARINSRAKALGVEPGELWDEKLGAEVEALSARWEKATARYGDESVQARRLLGQIEAYTALGVQNWRVQQRYSNVGHSLADQVFRDRLENRRDAEARRREATYQKAVRLSGPSSPLGFMERVAGRDIRNLASRVALDERQASLDPTLRRRLQRLTRAAGWSLDNVLRQERQQYASAQFGKAYEAFREEVQQPTPDVASLKRFADSMKAERQIMARNGGSTWEEVNLFAFRSRKFVEAVRDGKASGKDQAAFKAEIERLSKAAGVSPDADWTNAWRGVFWEAVYAYQAESSKPRRDRTTFKAAEDRLARIEPFVDKEALDNWHQMVTSDPRLGYLEARRRGEPGESFLKEVYERDVAGESFPLSWTSKGPDEIKLWARDHMERLRTLTELDRLDEQKADPQVVARIRALEKRAEELRARMGDPIVSIEAPGAKVVVAKMPDGSWLPMHRVAGTDRWEGRFDVPAGIADGRYAILVFVDGERKAAVPLNVDTSAPLVEVRWNGGRAEVVTDLDVKRVAGFTPSGERIELVREAPGRFAARVPAGTEFVATDGAHNRSDAAVGVDPSPSEVKWTNPGVVSAMAFVGDRLWVGTANDGGGFEGEARGAGRRWVKSAVSYGDGLAVRYADGAVVLYDSPTLPSPQGEGSALRLPRHSSCLAADGDTLLVGTIGGYFEVRGSERRNVFPRELAGLVVTALLRDGAQTWVGTQGRGLAEVSKDGRVTWHDERRGLRDDWITCLGRDAQGRIVAGTFVGGASVLDGGWKQVDGTAGTCVTGISGAWIATRQGVFTEGRRVSDEEATALTVRGDEIWIGTRQGAKRVR